MHQNNKYQQHEFTHFRHVNLEQSPEELKNEQSFSLWKSLNTIETPQFQSQTAKKWEDWGQFILFGMPELWSDTKGKGVKVALLDSGIDRNHPALTDTCDEPDNCDMIHEKNAAAKTYFKISCLWSLSEVIPFFFSKFLREKTWEIFLIT